MLASISPSSLQPVALRALMQQSGGLGFTPQHTGEGMIGMMATETAAPDNMLDLVTVQTDCTEDGTLVRVLAPGRAIKMAHIMPVFEDLGLNIVSYSNQRDPAIGPSSAASTSSSSLGLGPERPKPQHSFHGKFTVLNADGNRLLDEELDQLVDSLQRALHLRLSSASMVRRCGGALDDSRRPSVASYSEASVDPDSPSFVEGAPGPAYHHPSLRGQPLHHHHVHAASTGSILLTDACVGSSDSLLRVTSAANSDRTASSVGGEVQPPRPGLSNFSSPVHRADDAPGPAPTHMQAGVHHRPAGPSMLRITSVAHGQQADDEPSQLSAASTPQQPLPSSFDPLSAAPSQQRQASLPRPASACPSTAPSVASGSALDAVEAEAQVQELQPAPLSDERDGFSWWSSICASDAVSKIMSTPVRAISAEADVTQAKALMQRYNISSLLVDTGAEPGFITKRDFLKVLANRNPRKIRVSEVMTQPVIWVEVDAPIEACRAMLEAKGVKRVLVYDPDVAAESAASGHADPLAPFVGIISDTDLFKCMGTPVLAPGAGPALEALAERLQPDILRQQQLLQQQQQQQAALQRPYQQQLHQQGSSGPPGPASVSSAGSGSISGVMMGHASSASMAVSMAPSIASELAAPTTRLEPSAGCLADRYRYAAALWELDYAELEITRKIGEGSFGEVLLGSFRGTKVAIKRLRGFDTCDDLDDDDEQRQPDRVSRTSSPIFRQFFEREIEILATIRHPNVVNFIGACHTPPNVCLVTEFCARGSLDHLLHKSGIQLDLVKKLEFGMDIARGMSCLHAQKPPIIHRDLKTANLLVSARFEVKVADFGLSRIKDHAQLVNSRAGLEGTVEYCAPEVLRGEPYTEKCDIWSYGVLLWELLHRQRPYADTDVPIYILMMNLGSGQLRLPPVREEQATPGLARLAERCMSWVPADRPSFREILHILEAEYKIVRGKAAAVPRSDSASSIINPGLAGARAGTPGEPVDDHHSMHNLHYLSGARAPQLPAVLERPSLSGAGMPAAAVQEPQQQGSTPSRTTPSQARPAKPSLVSAGGQQGPEASGQGLAQQRSGDAVPLPAMPQAAPTRVGGRVTMLLPPESAGDADHRRSPQPTGPRPAALSHSKGSRGSRSMRAARSKSLPLPLQQEWFPEGESEESDTGTNTTHDSHESNVPSPQQPSSCRADGDDSTRRHHHHHPHHTHAVSTVSVPQLELGSEVSFTGGLDTEPSGLSLNREGSVEQQRQGHQRQQHGSDALPTTFHFSRLLEVPSSRDLSRDSSGALVDVTSPHGVRRRVAADLASSGTSSHHSSRPQTPLPQSGATPFADLHAPLSEVDENEEGVDLSTQHATPFALAPVNIPVPAKATPFSPFAGAADLPWSPRPSATDLVEDGLSLEQTAEAASSLTPSAAATSNPFAAFAAMPFPASPKAVPQASPFAGYGSPFADDAALHYGNEGAAEEHRHGGVRAAVGGSSGAASAAGSGSLAPHQHFFATATTATTASSIDVQLAVEKDQHADVAGGSPAQRKHPSNGGAPPSAAAALQAAGPFALMHALVQHGGEQPEEEVVGVDSRDSYEGQDEVLRHAGPVHFTVMSQVVQDEGDEEDALEAAALHTTAWVTL